MGIFIIFNRLSTFITKIFFNRIVAGNNKALYSPVKSTCVSFIEFVQNFFCWHFPNIGNFWNYTNIVRNLTYGNKTDNK